MEKYNNFNSIPKGYCKCHMKHEGTWYAIVGRYPEIAAIIASGEGSLSSHRLCLDGKLPSKWWKIARRWRGKRFSVSWDFKSQEFRICMEDHLL